MRVGPKERERIIDLLQEHGGNQNRVAKICGRAQSTVGTIANREGIKPFNRAPKNANAARRDFSKAERLALLNTAFEKGEQLIKATAEGREFKDLVIGIATLIDKRRVEDGEVSDRTESRKDGFTLADEFARLDASLEEEEQEEGAT